MDQRNSPLVKGPEVNFIANNEEVYIPDDDHYEDEQNEDQGITIGMENLRFSQDGSVDQMQSSNTFFGSKNVTFDSPFKNESVFEFLSPVHTNYVPYQNQISNSNYSLLNKNNEI